MKAWISLPLAVLTALMAACGKDDESKQKANDEQKTIKPSDLTSNNEAMLRVKDPSDCGYSNSKLRDND